MDKTNIYFVLLRRTNAKDTIPVQPHALHSVAPDIPILDILTFGFSSPFEAALLCRAPNNAAMAHLMDQLDGWHTDIANISCALRPGGRQRSSAS
jgi:hypothetical protein